MTELNDVDVIVATTKLTILQQATDEFYYSEYEIPIDILQASFKALRTYLAGKDISEEIEEWKKLLINEIQGSRFISGFEIEKLLTILNRI